MKTDNLIKIKCRDHTHAWLVDDRYIRFRCTGRRCREAQAAKKRGLKAIHIFDIIDKTQTTEFVADEKEPHNGCNV